MINGLFTASTLPVLSQIVNFAQARHDLLAGNVANMDTPGYQVRDLSLTNFQETLREAIAQRDHPQKIFSVAGEAIGARESSPMKAVEESLKSILYHDKSDVSLEGQVAELSKNQMMHDMAVTLLKAQFDLLGAAVSERV